MFNLSVHAYVRRGTCTASGCPVQHAVILGWLGRCVLIRSEDESLIIGAIIRLDSKHLPAREARSRCRSGLGASVVKAMLRRVDGLTLRQWKLNHDPPDEPAITVVPAEAGTYTP
jgi:hypothetical protein